MKNIWIVFAQWITNYMPSDQKVFKIMSNISVKWPKTFHWECIFTFSCMSLNKSLWCWNCLLKVVFWDVIYITNISFIWWWVLAIKQHEHFKGTWKSILWESYLYDALLIVVFEGPEDCLTQLIGLLCYFPLSRAFTLL